MLRHTWDRAARVVDAGRIVTIITAGQEDYLADEAEGGVPGTLLVQPANKDTGAGLLLPLLWVAQRQPGATVIVLPADHFIWEEGRFIVHATNAIRAAQWFPDRLVILGAEADGPEQSYGWVAPGAPCEIGSTVELNRVRRFWEKPDRAAAARHFLNGYLWNTFILAGQVEAFVRSARAAMPQVLESLTKAAAFLDTQYESDVLAAAYGSVRSVNFSKSVLAGRPEDLLVLAARNMYWSDWGSPDRILRTLARFNRSPAWLPVRAQRITE
jgi:mannose-1-phosphate guanylyltransferase